MSEYRDLSQWADNFGKNENVQTEDESSSKRGGFLSAESAVLVAGPTNLYDVDETGSTVQRLIPIGLVQQAQVSQSKQVNQIFEVGSRMPFFIPGRHGVRASMSRVLFDGPSLFYALYRGGSGPDGLIPPSNFKGVEDKPTNPYPEGSPFPPEGGNTTQADNESLGRFWTNLASSVFNKPIGLGIVLYDMEGQPYGGSYLEHCLIQSHNFGISANQTILAESISLTARSVVSMNAASLGNISSPDQ